VIADVTHFKPFNHAPTYVVPLNIVVKDTDEYVVDQIVGHHIYNPTDTQWRVRRAGYEASDDTWEPLANIKDVEVVQRLLHRQQATTFHSTKTFETFA